MTTIASIWNQLAELCSKPGMWWLPLIALFLFYLTLFALLEMAGSENDKVQSHPEILEEERKRSLDTAVNAAIPKYMNPFTDRRPHTAAIARPMEPAVQQPPAPASIHSSSVR